jgi:hypothetical protein
MVDRGRRMVGDVLAERGLLLRQGQGEVPSVADVLAGGPVTTRGYSWDYEPAWRCTDELLHRDDVAECKLLRGRTTLVHARLWPAVEALARASRSGLSLGNAPADRLALLDVIERHGTVSGDDCKAELGIDGGAFQRAKSDLERWLLVWGTEREDTTSHTHDRAWSPWAAGKIARAVQRPPAYDDALDTLFGAVFPNGTPPRFRPQTTFPALRTARP